MISDLEMSKYGHVSSSSDSVDVNLSGPDSSSEQGDMVRLSFLTLLKTALQKGAIKLVNKGYLSVTMKS